MLMSRYLFQLKGLRKSDQYGRFALEISIILIVKTCLLWLLWMLFFSHPINKTDRQQAVTQALLSKPQGRL
jgi:hypothetical protein